ncbi:glycosyltransferase [Bifidobacterium sp. UTBIF-78]|uniref:glycosyltransferase n=1 Tax=Bifidobacterium sp. UTBIF-78 TaxID=1465263 RepID=UPI00112773BF|nr:glycosyltransferase [Bifidobacterium sp. UTBIF-78]
MTTVFMIVGGVVEFDFSRPLRILDELVAEGVLDGGELVAQRGHAKYVPTRYHSFDFVDGVTFERTIDEADLIISHGGVSSLISALRKGKKVIAFPRLARYREHLDDHQTEITSMFADQGYMLYATDKESLKQAIERADTFEPKRFVGCNTMMTRIVTDFIENEC